MILFEIHATLYTVHFTVLALSNRLTEQERLPIFNLLSRNCLTIIQVYTSNWASLSIVPSIGVNLNYFLKLLSTKFIRYLTNMSRIQLYILQLINNWIFNFGHALLVTASINLFHKLNSYATRILWLLYTRHFMLSTQFVNVLRYPNFNKTSNKITVHKYRCIRILLLIEPLILKVGKSILCYY